MAEKVSGINMLFCSLKDILVITELLRDRQRAVRLQTADGAAVSCRPAPVSREVSRHKSQLTLHSSPPCYWKYEAEREQRESRERLPISRICSAADCGLDWPWQEPLATICSCLLPELLGFQLRNLVRSLIGKIDLCFWLKKIILNGIIGVKT